MRGQGLSAVHAKGRPKAAWAGNGEKRLIWRTARPGVSPPAGAATHSGEAGEHQGSTFWLSISERLGIVMEIAADHDSVASLPWLVRR
jgi:hypothetical protein